MQDFRKLAVWQRANEHAVEIRRLARKMPNVGNGDLRSQMVRAAQSIDFNIVEGAASRSRKDFARYLDISIKSSMELEAQLQLAHDDDIIAKATHDRLSAETSEIRRMLCALRKRLSDG